MNISKINPEKHLLSLIRVSAVLFSVLIIIFGCESKYYGSSDFEKANKIDIHVHLNHYQSAVAKQAIIDNFSLLTINTDSRDIPDVYYQQDAAMVLKDKYPGRVHYLSTFSVGEWGPENWDRKWLRYLQQTFDEGAIGVKVWKNIGMELRDNDSSFIMIDDPSFDLIFNYLEKNNIPVMAHCGEPKNCWLSVEEMTVAGDKKYFSNHPEYHMYQHPDYPSYEDQITARDNLLEKHPDLVLVGAHLASLEWDVDEIARHLDTYPNLVVETAARMCHLQYQSSREYDKVRDFMIKYQDRILYGTDLISGENENEADAMKNAHSRWLDDWIYLTTDRAMTTPEFEGEFRGLKLPREVVVRGRIRRTKIKCF